MGPLARLRLKDPRERDQNGNPSKTTGNVTGDHENQ
jgi:hypothetical protein